MLKSMTEMLIGATAGAVAGYLLADGINSFLHLDTIACVLVGGGIGGAVGELIHILRTPKHSLASVARSPAARQQAAADPSHAERMAAMVKKIPLPESPVAALKKLCNTLEKGQSATLDLRGVELLQFAVDMAPQLPVDVKKLTAQLLQTVRRMPQSMERDRLYSLAISLRDQLPEYVQEGRLTSKAMFELLSLFKSHHDTAAAIQKTHMVVMRDGGINDAVHMIIGVDGDDGVEVNSVLRLETDRVQMAGAEKEPYFTIPRDGDGRVAIPNRIDTGSGNKS